MLQAYSYTGDDYDYNLKRQEVLNGVLSAYTDGWDYSRQETSEGWIVVASREAYGLIQDLVGILYQHKCVNRTFLERSSHHQQMRRALLKICWVMRLIRPYKRISG